MATLRERDVFEYCENLFEKLKKEEHKEPKEPKTNKSILVTKPKEEPLKVAETKPLGSPKK